MMAHAGTVTGAHVVTLGFDNGAPDILFISVDKSKDTQAGCHSNPTWSYVISLSTSQGKNMYALLLSARATQAPVTMVGAGTCTVFAGMESLLAVYE
jgi:hypothetical protein